MRLRRLTLHEHRGATRGAVAGRTAVARRHGLLLEIEDKDGRHGRGECSPLPGYSPDTLEGCRRALEAWSAGLPRPFDPEPAAAAAAAAELPPHLPAARCGLETALLDLIGQRREVPLWRLLAEEAAPVPLAALVPEADASRADELWAEGFRTFKVKLGDDAELTPTLARLDRLRRRYGGELALRLDANGAFDPDAARRLLERVAPLAPEFLEQPVAPGRLGELGPSPVPLAADESLQRPGGLAEALAACRVLVLKPMVLGGLHACLDLAARARAAGLAAVVSHLFDGPVALAAAAHLALVLGPERAAGLAPHPGLAAWPAASLAMLDGAWLRPPEAPGLGVELAP